MRSAASSSSWGYSVKKASSQPFPGSVRPLALLNGTVGWSLLSLVISLGLWEAFARLSGLPSYVLPGVEAVGRRLVESWPELARHGVWTVFEVVAGFSLSAVVAIPLGMVIVYSRPVERLIYPPIVALNSLPKVAMAPLFVVWFGFGLSPKIGITFLIAFFPILVNTIIGLRGVDPDMVQLARSMNASTLRVFLKLRLPHALPSIFAGLKVATGLAVVGALIGEFIGSDRGWGYLLVQAGGQLDTSLIFAILVLLSALAVGLFNLVALVERVAIPWHASQRPPN